MNEIEKLKKKRDKILTEHDKKWQNEITLLERRVKTNFIDIDLGNGDTIAIRASISDAEAGRISKIDKERLKLGSRDEEGNLTLSEGEEDKANKLTYEILAIVTANPIMTEEFFAENRERYSTEDMLHVILGYQEQMVNRVKKASDIKSFRK